MRVVNKPITVKKTGDGQLLAFEYHGNHQIKQVIDHWREAGEWWAQEQEKSFYRVNTWREGLYELCYCHADDCWLVTKVFD